MMRALGAALAAFPNKKIWTRLQKNGMRADFSWDRSAGEYVKMYQATAAAERRDQGSGTQGI